MFETSKTPLHQTKRLFRRTNKIAPEEFKLKKLAAKKVHRPALSEQQLDQWILQTFNGLYQKQRFDQTKYSTQEALLKEGIRLGDNAKKMYTKIEHMLMDHGISTYQVATRDIWLFCLYQVLRATEYQHYQKEHIYTSQIGTQHSETIIKTLTQLVPNWLNITLESRM